MSELPQKMRLLLKTKIFRIFVIGAIIYWIGFLIFILTIYPDFNKTPGQNIFRDIIWIIYWRWNLDYLIIGGFVILVFIETVILSYLKKRVSDDFLSIYFSPIVTMSFAFLYMVAIDIGVTYFADTGFDANWETEDILFMGFTARELYHNFFFWYIPAIIICGITNQVYIRTDSFSKTFRAFCVLMAIYSLNLGFLDPIVCQILWNDWRIFGKWSMGGADAIFAEGWIAHYIMFSIGWFLMDYIIKCSKAELNHMMEPKLRK